MAVALGVDPERLRREIMRRIEVVDARSAEIGRKRRERELAEELRSQIYESLARGAEDNSVPGLAAILDAARERLRDVRMQDPPRVDMSVAMREPPPPRDEVVPGLAVKQVGMLVAPGGTGKSYLGLELAAAVASGIAVAGGAMDAPTTIGRVVYAAAEEPVEELRSRVWSFTQWLRSDPQIDPSVYDRLQQQLDLRSFRGMTPEIMTRDGERGRTWDTFRRLAEGARLLVIDPAARYHAAAEIDNGLMTRLLQHIEAIAEETGCAVLVVHHTSKLATLSGQGETQQAARGASALTDGVRIQWNLSGLAEAEAAELGVEPTQRSFWLKLQVSKANYLPPQEPVYLRRAEGGILTKAVPPGLAGKQPNGGSPSGTRTSRARGGFQEDDVPVPL